jgi:hypothetical protein
MPFTYDAYVLPTPRHRIPREAILRDYTDVAVQEVSLSDLAAAIEISEAGARITLYGYRGRLFREARSRLTGAPLSTSELELALSATRSWTAVVDGQVETPFDDKFFPVSRESRSAFPWAPEDSSGPMSREVLSCESAFREWRKPVIVKSNETSRRALAQHHYGLDFIIVGGRPFIRCPEPVWSLRTWPKPYALEFNATPKISDAPHAFRLDERARAEDWCREHGMRGGFDHAEVVTLDHANLTRDTVAELALSAITPLRRLEVLAAAIVAAPDGMKLASRLEGGQRSLDPWEAVVLLDTAINIHDSAVADLSYDQSRGDWRRLRTIVSRWKFERRQGRDLSLYFELSEDDIAALEGVPT